MAVEYTKHQSLTTMPLSVAEQRKVIKALNAKHRSQIKAHCRSCEMKGEGITDILKSVGKFIGPIAKEIGPVVLKELIIPMLKAKAGLGLRTAGSGKCSGCGHKKGVRHTVCKKPGGRKRHPAAKTRSGRGLRTAGSRGPSRMR